MKLIITRHGQTEENKAGIIQGHLPGKLSDEGITQAKALAKRLENEHFDFIYSSDLARATDTSKEIAFYHVSTPIAFTKELRERNMGELQGKNRCDTISLNSIGEIKNGETLQELFIRAKNFLDFLGEKHAKETILLVCHGGIGKALIAAIFGKDFSYIKNMESLDNTSVSIFEIDQNRKYSTICYNSIKHLE